MKKIGFTAGFSFLAGALFFALFFGYFHHTEVQNSQPILSPPVAHAESVNIKGMGPNFVPLVKKVKPAVVKVTSVSIRERQMGFGNGFLERFFEYRPRREKVPGIGSGFIISDDGYILTNNHVVQNAINVKINTSDEKEYKAKIIGTDPRTDLALLKIDGKNLPFIDLGDSNNVKVGEWVLAIGNPLGQDLTVTSGIISAKGRQLGIADYEDFLQTDAAINRGNSGGPLVNMNGKVIGINSVILAPSGGNIGIGFAIPSNLAKKVVEDLKSKGRVIRGYLGISIQTMSKSDAKEFDFPAEGVLVVKVEEDSPADIAGLKKYDLITEVDGTPVKKDTDLSMKIASVTPGDIVEITLYRKNKKQVMKVKVSEAPDSIKYIAPGDEARAIDLGMILINNSEDIAREYDLKTSKGILVKEVERSSNAYENNIRPADVILEANGKVLKSVKQFRNIVSSKKPGSALLLYINRNGEEGMIKYKLPE